MQLELFEVNAFTKGQESFSGSPAGICLLEKFLPDVLMQKIAAQNNLPETAFIVPEGENYHIRWFAPNEEVSLCGHATLAAAYVLFHYLKPTLQHICFYSVSGKLTAKKAEGLIELNFPARPSSLIEVPALISEAMGFFPKEVWASDDYLVVLESQSQLASLSPNLEKLKQLDRRGVVITAPGDEADFVSRVFHPKLGIDEDPACGSAHCELVPYWSQQLNKNTLHSYQLATRPAEFFCHLKDERVFLQGQCQLSYIQSWENFLC